MTSKLKIECLVGPEYRADLAALRARFPKVGDDIHAAVRDEVLPALRDNPIFPRGGAGDAMGNNGAYKKRVQNSSGNRSKTYGLRLIYRWHAVRLADGSIDRWAFTKLLLYDKPDQADVADEVVTAAIEKAPKPS